MVEAIRGKRIREESAATPVQVCVREKVASETCLERAKKRWKNALPITVPARNVANINVNA